MLVVPLDSRTAAVLLVVVLAAAIAGAAGFAALVVRRQTRRIAELTEALAASGDGGAGVPIDRVRDPRLREGFERLAGRLAATWTLATTDLLTGVTNRQALLMRLSEELDRAERYGRSVSIVLVDLDHFKRLNDSFGHAAGDRVLHAVATILRDHVRSVDIVGRYGGEEFMIVLPETDVDVAASIAEKLRRLVGSAEIELPDGDREAVTLSAGVAGGLGVDLALETLVRDADAALYSAKALGRDQVFVFRETGEATVVRRAAIAPGARERAVEVGRAALGMATDHLTEALRAREPWAGRPSNLIAEAAMTVARSVGLADAEIERIRVASLLHDLGKLAIPDEILSKPAELADPEWRVVAEHPKIGQVVLEQAGALRDAATIVLHHHEWYDGRGYPHGLSGEEIPIGARIVSIADAYEAMIAGRPYRPAISHAQALAELQRHAGVQFDPELVAAFIGLFEAGVPWAIDPSEHQRGHAHSHADASDVPPDPRSHAEIHDQLHERRRRVVAGRRPNVSRAVDPSLSTGTAG